MRKIVLHLTFLLFIWSFIKAAPSDLFQQANDAYARKNYQAATELYDSIAGMGYESAELYFNLGNSYFKSGRIANAILNYERAQILAPEDEDIEFNLRIANLQVADKIEAIPTPFFTKWWKGIYGMMSSSKWSIISIILWWIFFISLTAFVLVKYAGGKKVSFFIAVIGLFLFFGSFTMAYQQHQAEINKNEAIVFDSNVYVKSSPDESGTDVFILHEGTKVQLMDELADWQRIKLADGKVGWVKKNVIERI